MGRVLGDRYRVLSRLGEGGMGTVYLCEHAVLQRHFAVKVLRADLSSDAELVDRFRNEAIAASRIGQENVVDVVDFGADEDGSLYYVMEALDGRSLGAVIREEGPLAVRRALDVLEQICRALAAAHRRGVVHRDVKPDNVFLVRRPDGTERAKVIDFGISRVPGRGERITRVGAIIGTPEYMAPEQASGAAIDGRADVYAVGVLAFEMLTGELPLEAATPRATIHAHQTRRPDPPSRRASGVPAEVDALVLRALAKRPEDRFGSMDELAAEIGRIRAHVFADDDRAATPLVVNGPGTGRGSHAGRPSRPRGETVSLPETLDGLRSVRSRRLGGALALLAVVLAAAAVAWGWRAVGERTSAAAATSTSTPSPSQAPSASASPAPVETPPPAPPPPPVLVATDGTAAASANGPASTTRPRVRRPRAEPAPGLKDPYAGDPKDAAKLKDPFR